MNYPPNDTSRSPARACVPGTRSNGAELDNTTVHLMRIEQGMVTEAWLHNWDDVTVDRFWN